MLICLIVDITFDHLNKVVPARSFPLYEVTVFASQVLASMLSGITWNYKNILFLIVFLYYFLKFVHLF